ncbi:hypothetical protein ACYSNO_03285 [Enterococcus sp. LJL98]
MELTLKLSKKEYQFLENRCAELDEIFDEKLNVNDYICFMIQQEIQVEQVFSELLATH